MSAIVAPVLAELEALIQGGLRTFIEVGRALLEIRDRRLYRDAGYTEFDTYCRQRWGWTEGYATRNIQAAQPTEASSLISVPSHMTSSGSSPALALSFRGSAREGSSRAPGLARGSWNRKVRT